MRYSIRTRLTLLISLVYLGVFVFLLGAGALALYLSLNEEIGKELTSLQTRMMALVETEYPDVLTATRHDSTLLGTEFIEDLGEIQTYKRQFVIIALQSGLRSHVYSTGDVQSVEQLLPGDFMENIDGFYTERVDGKLYRILVAKPDWGTLAIGIENETFFKVAAEFKEFLLVGGPLTFLLVLIGGRFLAGQAMKPVVAAAQNAEQITLNNLSERLLPQYRGRDEFNRLVETLNLMITKLETGVKEIKQFTQDAAHELRTPLTILRGELELAYQQPDLPEEVRPPLQKSVDRAIAMSKIVENLMLLAQSDTGKYPVQRSVFRLDRLVRDVVEDIDCLADGKPVAIRLTHCDESTISGDRQLIERLLLNLADNALKNTEQGHVEFSLHRRNEKQIELTLADSGKGIPPEDLPYVFDRFYRVDKARNRTSGGSGLGLAICKWILELHGGKIAIESKLSEGTTLHLLLPSHPPV